MKETIIPKRLNRFIYSFFFLSGMTGLVYQVLWSKYLSNIFGSSAYAHTIVLAVFMGGLAFGNYFLGRLADRSQIHLLYLYGLIEIALGIYCMVYPNIATGVDHLYRFIGHRLALESTHWTLFLTQFFLNALSIFIPTILMGGTLPVMAKYLTRSRTEILNKVSTLYFINSAGAVLGSLFCGFFFIRLWGMDTSISFAAIINMFIGLSCLALSKRFEDAPRPAEPTPLEREEILSAKEQTQSTLVLWAIGASGFASMLYEIMWIRVLIQFFGSSVYSFSIVVAAFIAGITLGSAWLARRKDRIHDLYFFFGCAEGIIAVTMYFCVLGLFLFTEWIWFLHRLFSPVAFAYPIFLFSKFLLAFTILFIPSFFIGMTLPLASAVCSRNLRILGQEVGGVFSANTIGAVLGTSVAGLIFLPWLGITTSFLIGIVINAAIAVILLFKFRKEPNYQKMAVVFAVALVMFLIQPLRIDRYSMVSAMFRYRDNPNSSFTEYLRNTISINKILFFKEGQDGNVAVVKNGKNLVLYINGKPDASTAGDMPTQLLGGHLPALLHKNPKKVLIIGFGSGVSVGALTLHPSIEEIDCVEISKAVIEAGDYFKDYNNNALHNPKVRIIIDDAKNFLAFNNKKYDIIISEPTNPWTAGIGSLLTQEAFERIKEALNPDGIFLQWFHGYEMSIEIFSDFAYTVNRVFPFMSIWEPIETDYFFISQTHPLEINHQLIQERLKEEKLSKSLQQIKADNIFSILSTQILSEEKARRFFGRGTANRDRFPIIEFNAPLAFFLRQRVSLEDRDERFRPIHPEKKGEGIALVALLKDLPLEGENLKTLYRFLGRTGQPIFYRFVRQYGEKLRVLFTDNEEEKALIERILLEKSAAQTALNRFQQLSQENPQSDFLFKQYLKNWIDFYITQHSLFFIDEQERQKTTELLINAQSQFPQGKDEFILQLADFYLFHYETAKAFEEYFKIIRRLDQDKSDKTRKEAQKVFLLAADLSLKENDSQAFLRLEEFAHQYFADNAELLSEIKKRKEVFRSNL